MHQRRADLSFDEADRPCALNPNERLSCSLTIGKTYEVIGERLGMYAIVDDTGES